MPPVDLQSSCHTVLPGHPARSPARLFADMAAWCEANAIAHDVYGSGELIEAFERKVAALLGFEAAVFCISGTMAQMTALRLACEDRGSRLVALHPTSHIFVHEKSNYQLLGHFDALAVGERQRVLNAAELAAVPDKLGAVGLELPMREIGGQLPSWEELDAIKSHCKARGTHLHMDGARLWEAAAGMGRSPAEVAAGFDSVYVSLYKGIGGMAGAVLAGSGAFVARAAEWFRRQGGNVYQRSPYVVAAAMQFDAKLAAMPAYLARTQWLYEQLAAFDLLRPNPARPHVNMLHVHLPVSKERAIFIRDAIAREHGVWLFGRANHAALPDTSYVEIYVGENLLALDDAAVVRACALWQAALAAGTGPAGLSPF